MNAVVLKEYFTLAMDLQILWNCKYFGTELVLGRMRSVVERLNAFDLPHSRKLVPKLERMLKILDERHFKEFEQFAKGLPADDAEAVSSVIGQIVDSVLGEAEDRFTCILNRTAVSDRIRQLHERLPLNETQLLLRNEVIRCMESGAYRSAIVMGWNLAYDFIRTWMAGAYLLEPALPSQHRQTNWLKARPFVERQRCLEARSHKRAVFTAASLASKALDFLHGLRPAAAE
jgi:hypothetical protein